VLILILRVDNALPGITENLREKGDVNSPRSGNKEKASATGSNAHV
jgi:hypothetical protein